ncbi:hypothetical protein ACLMJK_009027 [Lecanora helva]
MFFEGSLQSGITLALRDSKYVVCFVKGTDEQSELWENAYLKDEQITFALSTRAVTLCINADSQEAGYLTAYYPVPVVPALVVLEKGQLLLDLRLGESKESFKAAVLKSLVNASSHPVTTTASASASSTTPAEPQTRVRHTGQASTDDDVPSSNSSALSPSNLPLERAPPVDDAASLASNTTHNTSSPQSSSNNRSSQTIQNLLADRRRKLEVDKREREAAEKAERKAKSDARQAAAKADPQSAQAKQATYAQEQRKRQQEAKVERERILRQIEHDKAERKAREEQRKALAKAEAERGDGAGGFVDQPLSNDMSYGSKPPKAKECAIQVRMFDGTTIRNRFLPDQSIRSHIRPWVDKERSDGDYPYTFKQILAPLPNRSLSVAEEEESLQSLSLYPSATMVMVPVQGYTTAYDGNPSIISRGATAGYSVVSNGASLISGALGTFLGFGQAGTPVNNPVAGTPPLVSSDSGSRGLTSGINVRTLCDQRDDREDHQLYNGNHLNFEPRKDSDDKEE